MKIAVIWTKLANAVSSMMKSFFSKLFHYLLILGSNRHNVLFQYMKFTNSEGTHTVIIINIISYLYYV